MRTIKKVCGSRRPGRAASDVVWKNNFYQSYTNLPTQINGVTPSILYIADGNGSFTNVYGDPLSLAGTGSAPIDQGIYHPNFGVSDHSTRGQGGQALEASTAASGNVGTDEIWLSFLVQAPESTTAVEYIFDTAGTVGPGVRFAWSAGPRPYFQLKDLNGNVPAALGAVVVPGSWNLIECCYNTTYIAIFINGTTSSIDVIAPIDSSMDSVDEPTIMGEAGSNNFRMSGGMSFAGMWHATDMGLDGAARLTEHQQRWNTLRGYKATVGNSADIYPDLQTTRASGAHVIKDTADSRAFIRVGNNWGQNHKIRTGSSYTYGPCIFESTDNETDESEDFSTGHWTLVNTTSCSKSTDIGPLGRYISEFISDTSTGLHYMYEVGGSGGTTHTMEVIAAAGGKDWMRLVTTGGGGNASCYYDLTNGVIGTESGSRLNSSYIKPLGTHDGKDWYRCGFNYDAPGAAHNHFVGPVAGDASDTFTGDGSVDLYFCHYQHETDEAVECTLPILCDGAVYTRSAEQTEWNPVNSIPTNRHRVKFDIIPVNATSDATGYFFYLTDPALTDRIFFGTFGTTEQLVMYVYDDAVNSASLLTPGFTVQNDNVYSVEAYSSLNDFRIVVDGDIENSDSSGGSPSGFERLSIAAALGALSPTGWIQISNFRIERP